MADYRVPILTSATGLTPSELIAADADRKLVSLAVATYPSLTELSYVKGVTSAIQMQIGGKVPYVGANDDVDLGTYNFTTTGMVSGGTLTDGTATLTGGDLTSLTGADFSFTNSSALSIEEINFDSGTAYAPYLVGTPVGLSEGVGVKGLLAIVYDGSNDPALRFLKQDLTLNKSLSYDIANSRFSFDDDVYADGLTLFSSNSFTLTQDGVNTVADVDGGYYKLTSPYKIESGPSLYFDSAPYKFYAGHYQHTTIDTDYFTGANDQIILNIGMNVDEHSSGTVNSYGTGCLDGNLSHRFYSANSKSYENGNITVYNGGVYGAVGDESDINSIGGTLLKRNMAFYSDIFFQGKETAGTHNAENFLFSGLIETSGHTVSNGTVTNAVLHADSDTFIVEATDETHTILDKSSYPWTKRADNSKIVMGAGDDFEAYWDGTNQVLDPTVVSEGGVQIITDSNTNITTDSLTIDLSSIVEGLAITAPILEGNAYSNMPEILPFPYAVGVYDRLAIFDKSDTDEIAILFSKLDLSNSGEIGVNLDAGYFYANWDWCPYEDDAYDLGHSDLRWRDAYFSGTTYYGDSGTYINQGTDGHLDLTADVSIDLNGVTNIGDGGTTNYASFASDGELTLNGTARVWKSWDVRPNAIKLPSANPPAEDNIDDFPMLRFDRGTEESVYYLWEVPNDFATGTGSVKGRFEFLVFNPPTSGGTNVAENVRMGFEYKKISGGAVFDFDAGTSSGYIDEEIAVDETAGIIHQTSYGVCNTTGWVAGDTILFRFYRDATAAEDTYDNEASAANNDVWVFDFYMNYLVDKLGEAT